MSWGSVANLGSANDKVAGTSISLAILATVPVGDVILVGVAKDNVATSDSNTNEITSITDAVGNTYTKIWEYTAAGAGADGGVCLAIYYTKVTTQILITNLITANFSDSRTASAITAWQFSITAGATVSIVDKTQGVYGSGADLGSLDLTVASQEHLWIRLNGIEQPTGTYTKTAAYSGTLTQDSTTGGASASNITITGEFDILTGTGNASDPTWSSTASDKVSILAVLKEAVVATGAGLYTGGLMGVGK